MSLYLHRLLSYIKFRAPSVQICKHKGVITSFALQFSAFYIQQTSTEIGILAEITTWTFCMYFIVIICDGYKVEHHLAVEGNWHVLWKKKTLKTVVYISY